ncbi:MAG: FAD:protein FMN transferase, partial [Lachnospiraceae bacterium]|nr:FAD:protein FMN transferase [Lachnospiraceae bacterium]
MMKKLFTLLLPILLSLNLLSGCNINPKNSKQQFERFNFYFDTIINIIVYNEDEVPYIDECFQLAQKYEELFSATKSGSDIWNINANAGSFVEVDEETIFLIEKALEYGSLSDGLFTITIGPLSKLWNISELSKTLDKSEKILDTSYLPSKDKITSALTHIGDNLIEINGNKVRLTDASTSIDLGGIAKGYIADKMKELLENN